MGLKAERKHILDYKYVYDNTKITNGHNSFRMSGKIENWNHIETIARIFYKKMERLLYGNETTEIMYESSIKKVLDENGLLETTLFNVIKQKEYQIEAINTMLIKVFDFVYFNVKKKLPYTKELSLYANAINELLENTFKYTSGEYAVTAGIFDGDYPLVIKMENNYSSKDSQDTKEALSKLKNGISEVNVFENPDEAYLEIMKKRVIDSETDGDEAGSSRLGFAKIRADTRGKITFSNDSKFFGTTGITIHLNIPIKLESKENILNIIKASI